MCIPRENDAVLGESELASFTLPHRIPRRNISTS